MIEPRYFLFTATIILPAIASAAFIHFEQKNESRMSYTARQIIIGVAFGFLAILGTEWGLDVNGLIINVRDAPVLCAGLLFGGPAGIIAGIIGGIERFIAVAWGAGYYTQIGCSLSTILAGFFAAGIRQLNLENKRPDWIIGFFAGLVMEAIHLIINVLTHLDDIPTAANVVVVSIAPMMLLCAISVMLSAISVSIAAQGGIKHIPREQKSIRRMFQGRLLVSFMIAFTACSVLLFQTETIVSKATNTQYLEQQLSSMKAMDLDAIAMEHTTSSSSDNAYVRMGDTGFILVSLQESGMIVSGPSSLCGKSMGDIGLGQANTDSGLYNATVDGLECECMDSFHASYRLTAVYPEEEALITRNRSYALTFLIQVLLFAMIFTLSDIVIHKYVIRPIKRVNGQLQEITDGNLNTEIDERTNKEFVQLSNGINATVESLKEYTRESERRIEQDLQLAHDIQHAALPKHFPPYPGRKEMDLFACMKTAREIGGDFYDFYFSRRNTLCFLVADVSGKGIPAAMFMMRAKTLLKDLAEAGLALDEVARKTNEQLRADNQSAMFVTLWLGSINLENGRVTYVNAGHTPPLVCHDDGRVELVDGKHDFVLGIAKNASYTCHELQLEEGDTIFLYTDGVSEAMNEGERLYGYDRLSALLSGARLHSVEEVCGMVMTSLDDYVQGAPQADDITMLALRFNGNNKMDAFTVPAKMEYLDQVTGNLVGKLREAKAGPSVLRKISTVTDELFSTIINREYSDCEDEIEIKSSLEYLSEDATGKVLFEMTLSYAGEAFNPLENETSDIRASLTDRASFGCKTMIVCKLMDSVEYKREEDRNVLTTTLCFCPEQ